MQTQSELEQREVRGGHTTGNRTWLHFVPRSNKYKYLHHTTNQDARRGDVEACSSAPKKRFAYLHQVKWHRKTLGDQARGACPRVLLPKTCLFLFQIVLGREELKRKDEELYDNATQ